MGSATREALDRAKAELAQAQEVTLRTGEQLLAAGRAIDGTPQLKALVADPSVESAEKGALVNRIFGSFDDTAVRVLSGIVQSRWSSPAQLIDGIEEIGIRAIARASGDDGTIEAELFAFARAVDSDDELELALGSKLGDTSRRVEVVESLLSGKASDATVALVSYAVQTQRGRRLVEVIAHIAEIVAQDAGAMVVSITAAAPPTASQLDRLRSSLTTRYGRTPRFAITIDPLLIGGLRVQIGDEVIDGSVANRLADLRLRLAG
ncbi:F0F1 ATP synthase subunit delta [Rathayibacter sp. KR2-224]|uniref:F0F1 ATP synthase subunit delta n=1 Tax=Rathayibacter sp. KR2-224 TaxID=3400913 RepID=UPI003BFFA142